MDQYSAQTLDQTFAALSDATRRGVVLRLGRSEASVSDLAEEAGLTLTGMKKHLAVLEAAGLVATEKVGRVRICRLGAAPLDEAADWIAAYRRRWQARFAALDAVLHEITMEETDDRQTPAPHHAEPPDPARDGGDPRL